MVADSLGTDTVDIPRHVEEELQVVARHLHIVYVGYPELAHIVVVGLAHLVVDKSGLGGGQPEVVVRTSPVAQVVVHTCPTLSPLLAGIGVTRHIAIVVVTPHQGHIVGHPQPLLIELQHLLIGHEHLHLLFGLADIPAQQLLLVVDHLLQAVKLLLLRLVALHRTVMDTPHADGEHIVLRAAYFLQPFYPVLLYTRSVGLVVEAPAPGHVPLPDIIAQQRLTMRSAYDDATAVGHRLGARQPEECRRALMHRRPYRVGPQSQQEFEYLPIGLGADLSFGTGFKRLAAPRPRAPVLVVDEDAAIGHAGLLSRAEVTADSQPPLSFRHDVAPPYPGRDTRQAREFQQSVGHPPAVAALHDDLPVFHVDAEAVGHHLALHHFDDSLI